MRCPVCEEDADPDRRQVRTAVYVFCCDDCAPRIRQTFDDERNGREHERVREGARTRQTASSGAQGPEAA